MQITLNITRGDILRFNLSKMLKVRANLITLGFAMIMAAGIAYLNYLENPTGLGWKWFAAFTVGGGLLMFVIFFGICLLFVLINSTVMSGALGDHTFTIEDAGLRERTEANDSLHYWHSLKNAEKNRSAIYVQVSPWMFHVLPRSGFRDAHDYYTRASSKPLVPRIRVPCRAGAW